MLGQTLGVGVGLVGQTVGIGNQALEPECEILAALPWVAPPLRR